MGLWLFTLPVIISVYYEFPLYSVFVNLLVVAFAPFIMAGGIAGTIIGMVAPGAGDIFFAITGFLLHFDTLLAYGSSMLPFSMVMSL